MQNTTTALEAISSDALDTVSGGCRKSRCCGGGSPMTQIFQFPQMMMPQLQPQMQAPPQQFQDPMAQGQPPQGQYPGGGYPEGGGDQVSTSVSINGQQQA